MWKVVLMISGLLWTTHAVPLTFLHNDTSNHDTDDTCQTTGCQLSASMVRQKFDLTFDPCHDFYHFACGNRSQSKIANNLVVFHNNTMTINQRLYELITKDSTSEEARPIVIAKQYYAECMNTDVIEKRGLEPLQTLIAKLGGWPVVEGAKWTPSLNWTELTREIVKSGLRSGFLVDLDVLVNVLNPGKHNRIIRIIPPNLVKDPNPNYRNRMSPNSLTTLLMEMTVALGADENAVENEVDELRTFIREHHKVKGSIWDLQNITMTLDAMQIRHPYVQWIDYVNMLMPADVQVNGSEEVVVGYPGYMDGLERLLNKTSARTITNFMVWKGILDYSAEYLNMDTTSKFDRFLVSVLGPKRQLERWEYCLELTKRGVPTALDALYIREYGNAAINSEVSDMVERVRQQLYISFNEKTKWMDGYTKQRAIQKLKAIIAVVGSPKELLDNRELDQLYVGLDIDCSGRFFEASIELMTFKKLQLLRKLRRPPPSTFDWQMMSEATSVGPQFFYTENVITLPAGSLIGQFFSTERPSYMNYGSIGTIIGHELIHGFDSIGKYINAERQIEDWWDVESSTKYDENAMCMMKQYQNYSDPILGINLVAKHTLAEDIADNAGVLLLYKTYQKWVNDKGLPEQRLPGLENFTPEQMFWIAYAQTYCTDGEHVLPIDDHSPSSIRVRGPLSNSEDFARDFSCPKGSQMNPENKCTWW